MSSLTNLFVEAPHMDVTGVKKLSENPDAWGEEITSLFRSQHPEVESAYLSINFTHKEDETGTAVGSLVVTEPTSRQQAYIPVIINNYRMYPLDIIIMPSGGKLIPTLLTAETLQTALFNSEFGMHLERPEDYMNYLYSSTDALGGIHGAYGMPVKHAHLLPMALSKTAADELEAFRQNILNNKTYLRNFEKNGSLQTLKRILSTPAYMKKTASMPAPAVYYAKNRDNTLLDLVTVGENSYNPLKEEVDASGFCDRASRFSNVKEHIHDLLSQGETIVEVPGRQVADGVTLTQIDQAAHDGKDLDRFAAVALRTKGGIFVNGVLFPRVIDFKMNFVPMKIFVSHDHSSIDTKFTGEFVDKEPEVPTKDPETGDFGCFVFFKNGKAIPIQPVEIISKSGEYVTCRTLQGDKLRVAYNRIDYGPTPNMGSDEKAVGRPDVFKIFKIFQRKDGTYVLPDEFKFVPLNNLTEMSENYDFSKHASIVDAFPVRVQSTGGGYFSVRGKGSEKVAAACGFDPSMLTRTQAAFILCGLGCQLQKTADVLRGAEIHNAIHVSGLLEKPLEAPRPVRKYASALPKLATDMFKEASFFDQVDVVDSLLSLNFINESNLEEFIQKVPELEEMNSSLAKMTLAARLGVREIPQDAAASAMRKIEAVIQGLKKLQVGGGQQ